VVKIANTLTVRGASVHSSANRVAPSVVVAIVVDIVQS
jgi:hypothetical protein